MRRLHPGSLGARMALVFSALLAIIGVFMLAFFPARMASQAQADAEERCLAIARVMSTALGPAIEFDDPENAAGILHWLSSTSDAQFGLVRRVDGTTLAVWKPNAIPAWELIDPRLGVDQHGSLLVVTTSIATTGGQLRVGFSLDRLAAQRTVVQRTVAFAVVLVVTAGIVATMLLARMLVRPIHTLTKTAHRIARGELPAKLPDISGTDEIREMAAALREMIEKIHEESQRELVAASRQAGMAEVATGVLHNVGNVLTSVNVTVEQVREKLEELPVQRVTRLHELLSQAQSTGTFDAARLDAAVKFVAIVAEALTKGRAAAFSDLTTLAGHVDHMKRVVSMQNAYARLRSAAEPTRIGDVLRQACEMACPPHRRADITLEVLVDSALRDPVMVDRHRILQIVVNLVGNARDAVLAHSGEHRVTLSADLLDSRVRMSVTDTGVGIPPAFAARIFGAGVTSKANGHGYGLHSSALAAREMQGSLTCSSSGEGQGATFVLEIPCEETPS